MRFELASFVLALSACTQPSIPARSESHTGASPSTEAAAGAAAPRATAPERQRGKPNEADPELDAGSGDGPEDAPAPVTRDSGQPSGPVDASVGGDAQPQPGVMPPTDPGSVNPEIVGTWYGMIQDALDRASTACVMLKQVGTVGPAGNTRYSGAFECTGMIAFRETVDGFHVFDEEATSGRGCPSGRIRLTPLADGTLRFNFFWNEGDIPESDGILKRVDVCP